MSRTADSNQTDEVRWNLQPAFARLEQWRSDQWRKGIDKELASIERALTCQEAEVSFGKLLNLDSELSAIYSARTLLAYSGEETSIGEAELAWLNHVTGNFIDRCRQVATALCRTPETLSSNMVAWCDGILQEGLPASVRDPGLALNERWRGGQLSMDELLLRRKNLDPDHLILKQRFKDNGLSKSDDIFPLEYQMESQRYFSELLDRSGHTELSLEALHDLEKQGFDSISLSLNQTLEVFRRLCLELDKDLFDEVRSIVTSGRMQIIQDEECMDLCVDTPYGSYVQVQYDESLNSAVCLAHEMGHAMHQYMHRNSEKHYLPLTPVESETYALAFENSFLKTLRKVEPCWSKEIANYVVHRRVEMNHRHRMLGRFEQGILHPDVQSADDINRLWVTMNRLLYGEATLLDGEFSTAWSEIHHLVTAPFYLAVYSEAKEVADRAGLDSLVRQWRI